MCDYSQSFRVDLHSNMSFLPLFRLPTTSRKSVLTAGPDAPKSLELCLDFSVHAPAPDESTSSRGNPDDSESQSDGNSRAYTDEFPGSDADTDDSESGSESEGADSPDNAESPATSRRRGSFIWDREKGGFSLEWANLAEFDLWRQMEERLSCINFIASTSRPGGILFSHKQRFVCGRQNSGGGNPYEKKHPERQRKIATKKSGCRCYVIIKQYHHTSTVLGRYVDKHDHEIGAANIAYTRLSGTARERIKTMLNRKIDRREIVSCRNQISLAVDLMHLKVRVIRDWAPDGSRDKLIALKEVNQMAQVLDNHKIRLHPDDAIATRLLLDELSVQGNRTFYKDKQDRTPTDLPGDAFVLCLQTVFQLDAFRRLGDGFIGIDATHNITQYENLLLFTIIARDRWGHGK